MSATSQGARRRGSSQTASSSLSGNQRSDSDASQKASPSTSSRSSTPISTDTSSTYHDPRRKKQHVQSFLAQKCFRARRPTTARRLTLWVITTIALILSWAIGYLQYSFVALFLLVIAMVMIWRDQSEKIARSVEQEIEIQLRRRKTVQMSETAEWVNVAISRWWVACSESVVEFLKDFMDPLLQDMAPVGVESVHLIDCDLANQTPFIKNIQLFDPPSTTAQSPMEDYSISDPSSSNRITIMANLDVGIRSPDSRLVIRARLGGRKLGYDFDVVVENLNVTGSVQAVVVIDYEAPFPHIASITATFVRKPVVWFTVKVLKGLKVTEVPLLKNWIHSFVMDIFTNLLVDPGKLTLNFMSTDPLGYSDTEFTRRARGVLTVKIRGGPPEQTSQFADDRRRWCTVRLDQQKYELAIPARKKRWEGTYSFLVYSLQEDGLVVKIKHRRVMRNVILAVHPVALSNLDLANENGEEVDAERTVHFKNAEATIALDLRYAPLPLFSLHTKNNFWKPDSEVVPSVAGVLYVHIHSGTDLLSSDADGLSDPYCVVLANKKKVLTTHYVLDTLNPKWEKGGEFFVKDFTQVSLTFVVYDWDGPLVGDDLLGVAKLNILQDQPEVLHQKLELEIDGNTSKDGHLLGSITVSVVFRPVSSVADAELMLPSVAAVEEPESGQKGKAEVRKAAKRMRLRSIRYPYESEGVLELTIIRGRKLVPKDSNGLSDPYVKVKYGAETQFFTKVKKKTLEPEWNENATLPAPQQDVIINVECWDKDRFSDDFMGSMGFTLADLASFENGPQWCQLNYVASGEVLLMIKRVVPKEGSDWLEVDERPLVEGAAKPDTSSIGSYQQDSDSTSDTSGAKVFIRPPTPTSVQYTDSSSVSTGAAGSSGHPQVQRILPSGSSVVSLPTGWELKPAAATKRRNTVQYPNGKIPLRPSDSVSCRSLDDSTISPEARTSIAEEAPQARYLEMQADIDRVLRGDLTPKRSPLDRCSRSRQPAFYYNVSGQVIEAEGLRGELDHLELYIKIRLNARPSHQRQRKFDRGPVVHKTRILRGSSNPQWKEDFMVKESPVPSDSLLTIDLKSGAKVNIGTHAITLDKFFDSQLKATKSLDIGNGMRLKVRLTRLQANPDPSPRVSQKTTPDSSPKLSRKL